MPDLNQDSLDAWNANADFWDAVQGDDGNDWQRTLIFPPTLELLQPLPEHLLELACGNGNFARAAARLGVRVTATDGAARQLANARARTTDEAVTYHEADVTSAAALAAIPGAPFDAAVCNMALMDIADLNPLFQMLPWLLADDAPFICSLLHPAFMLGPDSTLFAERHETADGRLFTTRGIKISNYNQAGSRQGIAVVGQPQLQPYFHRPLQDLLAPAFQHGWRLDALKEPSFPTEGPTESAARLRMEDVPEIPPILLLRFRRGGRSALSS